MAYVQRRQGGGAGTGTGTGNTFTSTGVSRLLACTHLHPASIQIIH